VTKTTGARFVAEALLGYGVTHVFFVPTILMKALAAMEGMGIRRIMVHGEKAAAYMADGYARASRRPGVCFAQHIGGSNLAAGLRDAYLACSPVIAITGGTAPADRYRHAYQEIEDFGQYGQTTKLNAHVDSVERLPDMLRMAFREATIGAPGPVHLEMQGHHAEVTEAKADLSLVIERQFNSVPPFRPVADVAEVRRARELLAAAQRPVIVAGGGVMWSQAQEQVVALAELLSVPVATSLNAKGTILDNHPLALGVVGGYSREYTNRAVSEADLVFFIGSHTGSQVTAKWRIPRPGTPVIHLDIDAREFGRNYVPEVSLLGDARAVLLQMLECTGPTAAGTRAPWLARVASLAEGWRATESTHRDSVATPMRPERLMREISRALPAGGVLVADTGHSGIWAGTMVDFDKRGQRLIRAAGSLGWSLPGALGVKCALPDTPVVCFAGDGALYYHIAELETAARYGINLVIVVNNNSSLNQEIPHFDAAYDGKQPAQAREMWGFRDVNFADVARSFGCMGIRVEDPDQLPAAFAEAFAAGRPVVIDAVTNCNAFAKEAWTGP
jgi:acetolactate synthase-1/2/3 large subunit